MSPYPSSSLSWKGKARAGRALQARADNQAGIVLPMKLVGTTLYESAYTISILVGADKQNLSLQVDSGSSDLWVAATSCSRSSCSGVSRKYDPSKAKPTDEDLMIKYVEGEVTGPIVWDSVQLGDYMIDNQALAAASQVDDEPLSDDFNGILGLALPLSSYIADELPPTLSNQPDGATFSSNLFGITPSTDAPSFRFISLALERPESKKIPSVLGIGKHPPEVVSDPSKINYAPIVNEPSGAFFWKTNVKAITVYQDGVVKPIALKSLKEDLQFPTAVIDSGMPIILASLDIANGIYGALGIGPASDGQYYMPCDVPLNLTITIDDRPEIPLHPLDLSAPTLGSSNSNPSCVGAIQAIPAGASVGDTADIVLGVPFMRSTYTVFALDVPDAHGVFPNAANTPSSAAYIRPRLGLLGLTDPTTALEEFHTVRVLNQPLDKGSQVIPGAVQNSSGGKKLSVGVAVLIGIVGFFAFCVALFGARWAYARRKFRRSRGLRQTELNQDSKDDIALQDVAYRLARRSSRSDPYGPSEDTLRRLKFEEYRRRTTYTDDTEKTRVHLDLHETNFAKKSSILLDDPHPNVGYQEVGFLPGRLRDSERTLSGVYPPDIDALDDHAILPPLLRGSAEVDAVDTDVTRDSDFPDAYGHQRTRSGGPGVAVPLLAHTRNESFGSPVEDRRRSSLPPRGPRPRTRTSLPGSMSSTGSGSVSTSGSRGIGDSSGTLHEPFAAPPSFPIPAPVETSDFASWRYTRSSSPSPMISPPPPPAHGQNHTPLHDDAMPSETHVHVS